ncbi:Ankyrin-repeat and fibronectin type III domain-containing 1 [Mortierella alpina]|nr:Ankyrin-repeat and fibronectin type III domain-containing 1 [Mortierella alpina]
MRSLIKVLFQEDGRKLERMFDFGPDVSCRLAVEQVCAIYAIPEDWALAMYSRKHGGWIHDDTLLMDIGFKGQKLLELRTKTPSFFEATPCTKLEPSKTSIRDSTLLRGPGSPIDPQRFFSFFRAPEEYQFVSKFQKGNIYLTVLIVNSENKILLSPSGLPPTVMIPNVGGLANYFHFDTESADFAWMFKTTLDWASESPTSRVQSELAALPPVREQKTVSISIGSATGSTLSAPTSRASFSVPKRGNVNSTTSTATKNTTMSSVSADRSSVASDSTKRASSIHEYADRKRDYRRENAFRQDYVAAVEQLQRKLGIPPIDLLYDRVVDLPQVGAKSIMAIQYVKDEDREHVASELVQMGTFRWRKVESVSSTVYSRKEEVWSQLISYYDNIRVSKPSPGLYIGLYYTESTMAGLQILVPKQRRTLMPMVKLREEVNLSQEEWDWMKSTVTMDLNQLAKSCAVPKEDPMHHLKVEFAHSTAKLSRLTQLKWNPSDMYTLDTMRVVTQGRGGPAKSTPQDHASSSPILDQEADYTLSSAAVPQSLAAMDMDPVWRNHPLGTSDSADTIRIIMFIKPTRQATQPQEHFNHQLFELCSFPIFDALHHSVFNTATYLKLRKTMLHLTNEIVDLELELELEVDSESDESDSPTNVDVDVEEAKVVIKEPSDMVGSLLIDKLGIKGDSPHPFHLHQHPRLRSSFIGDETLHASMLPISKRSSTDSLLEAFERSIPSASSVLSLASSLSSTGNSEPTGALGPQIPVRSSEEWAKARGSSEEQRNRSGNTLTVISNRFRSYSAEERILPTKAWNDTEDDDADNEGAFSFLDMLRDSEPLHRNVKVVDGNLSNGSHFRVPSSISNSISFNSSNSTSSNTSPEENNYISSRSSSRSHFRRESRESSRPLPPLPQTPNHRRSFSHVQSIDLGVSPSARVSRSRTTSHSSSMHSRQHSAQYQFHHQQPVYRNRFLPQKGYPHLPSEADTQNPLLLQRRSSQNQGDGDKMKATVSTGEQQQEHSCPPELLRLEKQQQELQEHWRMVSWTRQLNEWDHARMIKSQGEYLGLGIGMGLGLGLGLGSGKDQTLILP